MQTITPSYNNYSNNEYQLYIKYKEIEFTKESSYEFNNIKFKKGDEKKEKVTLKDLWINHLPAKYLQGFHKSRLPKKGVKYEVKTVKNRKIHCLSIEGWEWLKTEEREVTVKDIINNHSIPKLRLVSCLKVKGVKNILCDYFPHDTQRRYRKWSLVYDGWELSNENTLSECDVLSGSELELNTKGFSIRNSNLQAYTKGTRCSTNIIDIFKERIEIVCIIKNSRTRDVGTGFLIGSYRIMTNSHVFPKESKGMAKFFFEEGKSKISVELGEVEYESKSPDNNLVSTTKDILDFCIVKLKKDNVDLRIRELFKIADAFFNKCPKGGKELIEEGARANIIQHPEGREKEIAFRENFIHSATQFSLHYKSYTSPGSSGSPVVNDAGEFLGLHYSACNEIDRILWKKKSALLDKLGLSLSGDKYRIKNSNQELDVTDSGWHIDKNLNGGPRDLVTYIRLGKLENITEQEWLTVGDWIEELIKEWYPNDSETYCKHIYCNTAIPGVRIFEFLERLKPGVRGEMEKDSKNHEEELKKEKEKKSKDDEEKLKAEIKEKLTPKIKEELTPKIKEELKNDIKEQPAPWDIGPNATKVFIFGIVAATALGFGWMYVCYKKSSQNSG